VLVDGLGREFFLQEPAQKIVSLAPSNTEVLFAIGAGDKLVGRDSLSDYPEEALEVTDIGGGFGELDLESIVSSEPDLVLAASLTPSEQVQALQDLGIPVFSLGNPATIEDMFENLRLVAQLTGQEEETERLVSELEFRVASLDEKLEGVEKRPLVFYEIDSTEPDAPWTTGTGTFIDTMIVRSGGTNLGSVLEGEWVQISIEELLVQDPDIILLGDYTWGGVTPEDIAGRESWSGMSAIVNNTIYTIDDNLISRPGPRLVDGYEEMARILHPELFQ
jgi:iron complex transport system substrate-binding protein